MKNEVPLTNKIFYNFGKESNKLTRTQNQLPYESDKSLTIIFITNKESKESTTKIESKF